MADEKELARKAEEELNRERPAGVGAKMKGLQLPQSSEAVKIIAEHKIAIGETLTDIALKHYGNAGREFWMAIYEANKDVIGDNPGLIKPGTVLKIPEKK